MQSSNNVAFDTLNLSHVKLPIVNILFENASETASIGSEINTELSLENNLESISFSPVDTNNHQIVERLNFLPVRNCDDIESNSETPLQELAHFHTSEYNKFEPIVRPSTHFVSSYNKNEINGSHVNDSNISVTHGQLDTVDSMIDNAVIVVDYLEEIDHNIARSNTSNDFRPKISLEQNYDSLNNIDIKNDCTSFIPDVSEVAQFNSYPNADNLQIQVTSKNGPDEIFSHEDCIGEEFLSFPSYNTPSVTNDVAIIPTYPHFLCLICGKSELVVMHSSINIRLGKKKCKAFTFLTERLKLNKQDVEQRGDKLCDACIKHIIEIEELRERINGKETELIELFSSSTNPWLTKKYIKNITLPNFRQIADFRKTKENHHAPSNTDQSDADHRKGRQFRCFKCHVGFPDIETRNHHSRNCEIRLEKESAYSNKKIKRKFASKTCVKNVHSSVIRDKLKSLGFPCKQCHKVFPNEKMLSTHISTHSSTFDCHMCGRFLTSKARLSAHLFKFHGIGEGKKKDVKCHLCDKSFQTKAGLSYHQTVAHQTDTKYVCEHCNKVYYHPAPYRSHVLFAHGKKKIVCETCGEMFFTVSKLNTHINAIHRSAATWHCAACDVRFTTGTAYRQHNLTKHHNTKHSCSICPAQFRKKSALYIHLRDHSIYKCHLCKESFIREDLYTGHLFNTHRQIVSMKRPKRNLTPGHITVSKKPKVKLDSKKIQAMSKIKSVKILAESSNSLNRINLNDILLTNSYNSSSSNTFQVFTQAPDDNMQTINIHDSCGKIRSFDVLNSSSDLQTVSDPPTEPLCVEDNGVSLFNVEILNNIEITTDSDHARQSAHNGSIPSLVIASNHHRQQESSIHIVPPPAASDHHQLAPPTDIASTFINNSRDGGVLDTSNHAVLLNESVLVDELENCHNLEPSSNSISDNTDVNKSSNIVDQVSLNASSSSTCEVVSDYCVDDHRLIINGHHSPNHDIQHHQVGASAVVSMEPSSVVHDTIPMETDRVIDPSHLWIKDNTWALLKGTNSAADENIANFQQHLRHLPSSDIEDLDMAVIGSDIVEANVIAGNETISLESIDVAQQIRADEDLDVTITGH